MKIIGYKCQYCKKNFPTNDFIHERACRKSNNKLKLFKQKFFKLKRKIIEITYKQLKTTKDVIDSFEAAELLETKMIKYGDNSYYNLRRDQYYFQNENELTINSVINLQLDIHMPNNDYHKDLPKENCVLLIRESILRKFKKIYPSINVW